MLGLWGRCRRGWFRSCSPTWSARRSCRERAPDEMAKALARHELLLTAAVEAEGGMVLKAGGESDSTFSVFPLATDALRAGHRLQAAVRAEAWPAAAVIRIRVAVHTGEAVERDGDYFGPAVNRVARLRRGRSGWRGGGERGDRGDRVRDVAGGMGAGRRRAAGASGPRSAVGIPLGGTGPRSDRAATTTTGPGCLAAGGRGPRSRRGEPDERGDRGAPVHLRAHRGVARVVTASQARRVRSA